MHLSLSTGEALRASASLLILPITEADLAKPSGVLGEADGALDGALLKAAAEEGFKARADQSYAFHTHGKLAATRVVLVGLGAQEGLSAEVLRQAAGRAAKIGQRVKSTSAAVLLPAGLEPAVAVRAAAEGLLLGAYRFDRYKTQGREAQDARVLEKVALHLPEGAKNDAAAKDALKLAEVVAGATNWARDQVNEPACVITPKGLANAVVKACKPLGLKVTVGGRKEIQAQKMGMFLAVGQASTEEHQLIHVVYTPKDPKHAARPPLALVGKAITFDSGGLSLKPSDAMLDMKIDMGGSAAVFGAMQVVAHLAPPFPVHAFVGACENMVAGNAYKLGDVLHSRAGKTVEVTNTDAEGRLVLGDILHWACEHQPFQLVDLATLTGACMVALGHHIVGAFSPDEAAAGDVMAAAESAGELMWRMPMHELQKETLRSEIADMKNAGERYGGASSAALFLKEFVGKTPWVHLDIAGPASSNRERGYFNKGATGVGVRTLVELVRRHAENPPAVTAAPKKAKAAAAKGAGRARAK